MYGCCMLSNLILLVLSLDAVSSAPVVGRNRCLDPSKCQTLGETIISINTGQMSEKRLSGVTGFDVMKESAFPGRRRRRRRNTNLKDWPKSDDGLIYIPFKFRESITETRVTPNLRKAMEEFKKHTCFRLIPRTNETHYVEIISYDGCWSYVGRIGGKQEMSLSLGCEALDVILHEFMHVIGYNHEHQRVDRNEHIRVNYANIDPKFVAQYNTIPGFTHGKDYDYTSLMHYGRKSGAQNRDYDAMTPIPDTSVTLGPPIDGTFSPGDIKTLNLKSMCGTDITVYSGVYAYKSTKKV